MIKISEKKLLIVDDEKDLVSELKEHFERRCKGYKVFTALNGVEALGILKEEKIGVVLTDLRMPIMSGEELIPQIKAKYPDIEVIILSAYGSIKIVSTYMKEYGVYDYISKGEIDIDKMLYIIEKCFAHINQKLYFKKSNPLKVENTELKRKLDLLSKKYNSLSKLSQEKIKEHPDSMTLSEYGDLVAGITHSLTTEIGIINSTLKSLLDEKGEDDLDIKRYKRLSRSAKYSNVLLNNLRYSLLEGKPSPEKSDIKELFDEIIYLFEYRIPSNVKLITEISPNLPELVCDKNQIEQALVNTINNAMEAMPEGGELSIKAKTKKSDLHIEISDTGVGIPKKNLKNVFKINFSTKKTGFGLGLYLTKRIVEQHNGNVSLKSQEGKGTTIIIGLPINNEK